MNRIDRDRLRRGMRLLARLLLGLGAAGVLLQLELAPKVARSLLGWGAWLGAGGPAAGWPVAAISSPLDEPLAILYRALTFNQPLLPWLVWLAGAGLLFAPWVHVRPAPFRGSPPRSVGTGTTVPRPTAESRAAPAPARRNRRRPRLVFQLLVLGTLIGICLLGGAVRATNLLPDAEGAWPASNFDEMVYYTNARLLAQGELPYRDHFLAHPPGVTYMFALGLATQPRWGGPVAFGTARLWLLGFSLLALPLMFLAGRRLGGSLCGLLAAGVLALDGKAAGVAVLETAVNVWSLLALVLYLYTPRTLAPWQRALWVGLTGASTGFATLAKVPGIALAGALPLHALLRRRPRQAVLLGGAAGAGVLLGLLPFLLVAPDALVRQTFFFQMLRPQEVRPGIDQASRIANYPESLLTILGAMLGLAVLTAALVLGRGRVWRRLRGWVVVVLWALPVLAVFVVGRSYHSPYYVQWAPPLALLAGALAARPVWRSLGAVWRRQRSWPRGRRLAGGLLVPALLLLLPFLATQWQAAHTVERDRVYLGAGATLAGLVPAGEGETLAFDPGYTFVAGRPPVLLPNGARLIDSAGAMVYYGTNIDQAPWSELADRVLHFSRERNAQETFYSLPAQASMLAALPTSVAVVIDGKIGEPQLRPQSIQLIQLLSQPPQKIDYAHIYPRQPDFAGALIGYPFQGPAGLELWTATIEGIHADGSGAGPHLFGQPAEPSGPRLQHRLAVDDPVVQLGLYWRVPASFGGQDYRVGLALRGPDGQPVVQTATRPDEDRAATSTWRAGWIYPDLHNLALPPGPGQYTLAISLYPDGQPAAASTWQVPMVITRQ
jgi:4-amino-4-deoxy-L-arabinose transferase-like glycosyltransferase